MNGRKVSTLDMLIQSESDDGKRRRRDVQFFLESCEINEHDIEARNNGERAFDSKIDFGKVLTIPILAISQGEYFFDELPHGRRDAQRAKFDCAGSESRSDVENGVIIAVLATMGNNKTNLFSKSFAILVVGLRKIAQKPSLQKPAVEANDRKSVVGWLAARGG